MTVRHGEVKRAVAALISSGFDGTAAEAYAALKDQGKGYAYKSVWHALEACRRPTGQRILLTGGTGSFGRAFARRMVEAGATVCVYSRGEHAQADMREQFDSELLRWFIGDVRDRGRLRRAMEGCDVVIHAAALKRIEVGAYCPDEMIRTNVGGAENIIEASVAAGVKRVVMLSTDKAYQPVSPYGQSKALAESLFLSANDIWAGGPRFSITRYGNVFRSTGSVVPRWEAMIAAGAKTVPVTDPDCTRFFMTMEQAVQLVVDTLRDMPDKPAIPRLPAYRLGDLAEAMGVGMEVIGLPSWEKRHEGMCDGNTSDVARRMTVDELREALRG